MRDYFEFYARLSKRKLEGTHDEIDTVRSTLELGGAVSGKNVAGLGAEQIKLHAPTSCGN